MFKIGSVCICVVGREREKERDWNCIVISIQIKEMETHLSVRSEFKYSDDTRYSGGVKKWEFYTCWESLNYWNEVLWNTYASM